MRSVTVRPAENVGWVIDEHAERVVLSPLPSGPIQVLEGPAAVLWEGALKGGTTTEIVQHTLDAYPDSPPEAASTLNQILDTLIGQRLLRADEEGT